MYEDIKNKKLLILGGISAMIEVIERAHELGIIVYVTDYLKDSPAKKYADKSFMVSTTDIDAVVKLINDEKIDGLYTGNIDSMLPYYAQICEKAKLPCYGTLEHFSLMTDKKKFKDLCREYDVPVIPEYSFEELQNNDHAFPVLVKPIDSSGSRGISICQNKNELLQGIGKALQFSPSKQYIIEKYMTSEEVVLYYYFQDGNPVFVCMCDRYVYRQPGNVAQLPTAYVFPSQYTQNHLKMTNDRIINMFKSIGMQNGPLFLQAFIDNGVPCIYEPGYRTNGAREQYIINKICGVSSVDMLINYALTGKESSDDISAKVDPFLFGGYACKLSPLIGKGKVKRIEGIEKLGNSDGIVKTVINKEIGSEVKEENLGTLNQIGYRCFIVADEILQLKNTIEYVQNTVVFYDDNEESMMLEKFDANILKRYDFKGEI